MTRVRPTRRAVVLALLCILAVTGWSPAAEPGSARFRIEPEASEITFKATSRLMNADGTFHRSQGEVVVDPRDLTTARIILSVEAASIDTGIGMRDRHLRSEDFLHVERFPVITFESLRVEASGRRAIVSGRLALHGVTREVTVPVDVTISDTALVASGVFVLNRRDYGITYQSFMNPIGNEVRVAFTIRARAH